jgi:hypothetical protein
MSVGADAGGWLGSGYLQAGAAGPGQARLRKRASEPHEHGAQLRPVLRLMHECWMYLVICGMGLLSDSQGAHAWQEVGVSGESVLAEVLSAQLFLGPPRRK